MEKQYFLSGGRAVLLTDDPQKAKTAGMPVIGLDTPGSEKDWSGVSFLAWGEDAVDEEYAELVWRRFHGLPVIHIPGTESIPDTEIIPDTKRTPDTETTPDTAVAAVAKLVEAVEAVEVSTGNPYPSLRQAQGSESSGYSSDTEPVEVSTTGKYSPWCLRELVPADAPALAALYADAQVRRFLTPLFSEYPEPVEGYSSASQGYLSASPGYGGFAAWIRAYARFEYASGSPALWAIARPVTLADELAGREGELLGLAGAYHDNAPDGFYIGYALLPKVRRKGLATAVVSRLCQLLAEKWDIRLLYLRCDRENVASIGVAERCGFKPKGNASNHYGASILFSRSSGFLQND